MEITKASQYKQRFDRDPSEGLKRKLSADEVMKLTNELGDWRSFTAVPEKIREYSEEPSFRAALSAFSDMDSGNKRQTLQGICQVTIEPDGRVLGACCHNIQELNCFMPIQSTT